MRLVKLECPNCGASLNVDKDKKEGFEKCEACSTNHCNQCDKWSGKCIDCENCIIFCPDSSVNKQHDIDYDYCKGCGICAHECPSDAIEMVKE